MKSILALALLMVGISCSKSSSDNEPTSADRDKFVGTWAGTYSCSGGIPVSDTLVISLGSGALDFTITIHVEALNPDTVSGELTEPNLINVPEQLLGGFPGTAQITTQGDLLSFHQTGAGLTCGGTDYSLVH